jgi:hypothetical protein
VPLGRIVLSQMYSISIREGARSCNLAYEEPEWRGIAGFKACGTCDERSTSWKRYRRGYEYSDER